MRLVGALTFFIWAGVCVAAHAEPQIIRVGEDSPAHTKSIASIMKRYGFTPVAPVRAADFYANDVAGGTLSLAQFNRTWTVLVFFTTWCGPCAREMPSLNAFANQGQGTVQVVGIATDSPERDVAQYVRRFGLSFAVAYDAGDRVAHAYGVHAFPTIYFLEPGGKIIGGTRGAMDWLKAVPMIKELQRLRP